MIVSPDRWVDSETECGEAPYSDKNIETWRTKRRSGVDIKLDHGVDNMAMAMSLVASTRGLA